MPKIEPALTAEEWAEFLGLVERAVIFEPHGFCDEPPMADSEAGERLESFARRLHDQALLPPGGR